MGLKKDNNMWLKRYMKKHSLTRPQIASRLLVGLSTVDRWLAPKGGISRRKMPDMAVALLETQDKVKTLENN